MVAVKNKNSRKAYKGSRIIWSNLVKNWLHQAITYMDAGELIVRVILEFVEIAILSVLISNTGLEFWAVIVTSIVVVHTANWILNGNWWALIIHSFPNLCNNGIPSVVEYLNWVASELNENSHIEGVVIFGSISRGTWSNTSDIDIRIIRRRGLWSLIVSAYVCHRLRTAAFFRRQPLDLFLADDVGFLKKMRMDEKPLFLVKRGRRLEEEYPNNDSKKLTLAAFEN